MCIRDSPFVNEKTASWLLVAKKRPGIRRRVPSRVLCSSGHALPSVALAAYLYSSLSAIAVWRGRGELSHSRLLCSRDASPSKTVLREPPFYESGSTFPEIGWPPTEVVKLSITSPSCPLMAGGTFFASTSRSTPNIAPMASPLSLCTAGIQRLSSCLLYTSPS